MISNGMVDKVVGQIAHQYEKQKKLGRVDFLHLVFNVCKRATKNSEELKTLVKLATSKLGRRGGCAKRAKSIHGQLKLF